MAWHGMGVKFNPKHVTALVSVSGLRRQCSCHWTFDAWQQCSLPHAAGVVTVSVSMLCKWGPGCLRRTGRRRLAGVPRCSKVVDVEVPHWCLHL